MLLLFERLGLHQQNLFVLSPPPISLSQANTHEKDRPKYNIASVNMVRGSRSFLTNEISVGFGDYSEVGFEKVYGMFLIFQR